MSVRAQYGPGVVGGEPVVGYLQEEGVPPDSHTETYAALRLEVDNWRWAGVPFYLRTGKRLARKITEIAVTLRPVPHLAFEQEGSLGVRPNQLVMTIQPNEGVSLSLGAKIPGHADADPPGQHGVPLRDRVPLAVPGGLRAADPRRDARRGDAVHAQRRGRGAVAHLRPDRVRLGRPGASRCRSTRPAPRAPRRPTRCCSRATGGARSEHAAAAAERLRVPAVNDTVWAAAEHDAGRGRGGAARPADRAPQRERRLRAGARAQPDLHRRAPVERRDRQPPAPRRALPPLAHDRLRGQRRAHDDRRGRHRRRATRRPQDGEHVLTHETVILDVGPAPPRAPGVDRRPARDHRPDDAGVGAARPLARRSRRCAGCRSACSLDSVEDPDVAGALRRAQTLLADRYVVDLAWLRSTPWRERIATLFDQPSRRPRLREIAQLRIRNVAESGAAALLLCGWLTSRLRWPQGQLDARRPRPRDRAMGDVSVTLESVAQDVPGLGGVTIGFRDGGELSLDRGPGGLSATRRDGRRRRAHLDAARRLARRGRHPRRGHAPVAAARPHLPRGARRRRRDADVSAPTVIRAADGEAVAARAAQHARGAARRRARRARARAPRARGRHDAGRRLRQLHAAAAGTASSCGSATSAASDPTDPESNYLMAGQTLLGHADGALVHRIEGELGAERAAAAYDALLRERVAGEPSRARRRRCSGSARTATPRRCFPTSRSCARRGPPAWRCTTRPSRRQTASRSASRCSTRPRSTLLLATGAGKAQALARGARAAAASTCPRACSSARA